MIRAVIVLDRVLALAIPVAMGCIYPASIALTVGILLTVSFWILAGRIERGQASGFWFQLVFFAFVLIPLGFDWLPFGVVLPAAVVVKWIEVWWGPFTATPRPQNAPDHTAVVIPLTVVLAVFQSLAEVVWLFQEGPAWFIGYRTGWLWPLRAVGFKWLLSASLIGVVLGLLYRKPWARWLAPPLIFVGAFPVPGLMPYVLFGILLALLTGSELDRWFPGTDYRANGFAVLAASLPLALSWGWIHPGTCDRHDLPLYLVACSQSPLMAQGRSSLTVIDPGWGNLKVYCPADELAVICDDLQTECLKRRITGQPNCPYDPVLRQWLPGTGIPPNRYDSNTGTTWPSCQTCKTYGRPEEKW